MKSRVFLAGVLIALTATAVFAQANMFTEGDFYGKVNPDGKSVSLYGYKGKATVVNIPAKMQNLPVTEIVFETETPVTSVTIPNGVTTIFKMAFMDCKSLTSVTIPASVTSIGEGVFLRCESLTSITFSGTIALASFHVDAVKGLGDIRSRFYATNANGTPGTYTRPNGTSMEWTKK
jgi:hypothetical protein